MKKILLTACGLLLISLVGQAQKYVIIDTRYILDKMPDYKSAQAKLDPLHEAEVRQRLVPHHGCALRPSFRPAGKWNQGNGAKG